MINNRMQRNITSKEVERVVPFPSDGSCKDPCIKKKVVVRFKCKKCGKAFLASVDEEKYKYVLKDALFLKSKTCSSCKLKTVKNFLKKR